MTSLVVVSIGLRMMRHSASARWNLMPLPLVTNEAERAYCFWRMPCLMVVHSETGSGSKFRKLHVVRFRQHRLPDAVAVLVALVRCDAQVDVLLQGTTHEGTRDET